VYVDVCFNVVGNGVCVSVGVCRDNQAGLEKPVFLWDVYFLYYFMLLY
jgi:hypothetical protein